MTIEQHNLWGRVHELAELVKQNSGRRSEMFYRSDMQELLGRIAADFGRDTVEGQRAIRMTVDSVLNQLQVGVRR